jgi:hypothetical protein
MPISKITNTKRAGGIAQVVVCLPSKDRALSSNPCTAPHLKKKKKKPDHFALVTWEQHMENTALQ